MCLENLPQPKFCMGQQVQVVGVSTDEVRQPYQEIGVIFGLCYLSDPTYWQRPGWHYYIHFTYPRTLDDDAHEDDLSEFP